MRTIREILNRIRWDERFGAGAFEIGYHDRVRNEILRVPFLNIEMRSGNAFSFELETLDGDRKSIPFHRVRAVWKDGELIWERPLEA